MDRNQDVADVPIEVSSGSRATSMTAGQGQGKSGGRAREERRSSYYYNTYFCYDSILGQYLTSW